MRSPRPFQVLPPQSTRPLVTLPEPGDRYGDASPPGHTASEIAADRSLENGVTNAPILSIPAHDIIRSRNARFARVIDLNSLDTNSRGISNGKFDTNPQSQPPYYKSSGSLQRSRPAVRNN
jgi:hypothetical protein